MKSFVLVGFLLIAVSALASAQSGVHIHHGRGKHWSTKANRTVGDRLSKWAKKQRHQRHGFPHEQGANIYHEFDIMLRPGQAANGIALSANPDSRWPNAVVPFVIQGSFSDSDRTTIKAAMDQFAKTTCVRFVPRTSESLYITIGHNATGCWSYVGKSETNEYNQVNLQIDGCMEVSTVAHELMHAIGFYHEVSRPDRDDYITIDFSALSTEYNTEEFKNSNYQKVSADQVDLYGIPYNYGSTMHYSRYAAAASDAKPVLVNKKQWEGEFGCETGLAAVDIAAINAMYCKKA